MSTLLTWAALSAPAAYLIIAYSAGSLGYGDFIHRSGQFSVGLLLLVLAVTPLRKFYRSARWVRPLASARRAIGVASFGYALLHTLVYLEYKWGAGLILREGLQPGLGSGWLALLLMLLLAATSNDFSVRRLGRRWKTLHWAVYPAALLTLGHWLLTSFTLLPALTCLLLLIILLLARRRKRF